MTLRNVLFIGSLLVSFAIHAGNGRLPFPQGPHLEVTPGKLCDTPSEYRYDEHVPYCERNVSSKAKAAIMVMYDEQFGYEITKMERMQFKIDHYIPLCAGGSNDVENLWPQHQSVYEVTDPLEPLVCEKMKAGKLLQNDAVEFIKMAKNNLDLAESVIQQVSSL